MLLSCGAFKKTKPTPWPEDENIGTLPEKKDDEKKPVVEDKPKEDKKEEKEEKEVVYSMVDFKGESYRVQAHKKAFEIAVLLPFHSDNRNTSVDERRAGIMLEYYQGMKLAIPKIRQLESSYKIRYYDTDNDTNKLKTILNSPELDKVDLIIGPTDDAQVKIAAYFARKREIPMISPLTTIEKMWSNNPYVFFLNPSEKMQATKFLEYFKKEHKDEKLLIVRDGKQFDRSFGKALVDECIAQKINFDKVAYHSKLKWANFLGTDKTVVVNTSQSKRSMTDAIAGLLHKAKDVTLIGPDSWMEFHDVDYGQLEQLRITYISTNKAQIPNQQSVQMYEWYTSEYSGTPSWYTYMGYDQLLFSCEILDAFGKYFPLFLEGKNIPYANSDYMLKKEGNCFQNSYLELFQLRDKELIRVK